MGASFLWGLAGASTLVLGALVALRVTVGGRTLGLIMAFGSGVLVSALAFELVAEALHTSQGEGAVALGLLGGSLVFFAGDAVVDRMGGEHRKDADGRQAAGSALAIVLGAVLDGIPESAVLGLSVAAGEGVSVAFLLAVALSNVPEALAASSGLARAGWAPRRVVGLWTVVALVSGLASLAGYAAFDGASPETVAFVLAFAGGAILTMLADTMMPEAFARGGRLAGVVTTIGFALGVGLQTV